MPDLALLRLVTSHSNATHTSSFRHEQVAVSVVASSRVAATDGHSGSAARHEQREQRERPRSEC